MLRETPLYALSVSALTPRQGRNQTPSQRAEDAGFQSVWTFDTHQDVFAALASHAVGTSKIALGSGIAVWHRTPVGLLNAVNTLDEISGGRTILGLGTSPKERNENWYGVPFERPIARMAEYIRLFRKLWNSSPDKPVNHEGAFFNVRNFHRLHPPGRPAVPVYIGTVGPQMNRLAGALADGVLFDVALSRRYLAEVALPAIQKGLAQSGRDPDAFTVAGVVNTSIDPDRAYARRRAKRTIIWYSQIEYFHLAWQDDGFRPVAEACRERFRQGDLEGCYDIIPDEMVDALSIAGTPDECREKVRRYDGLLDVIQLSGVSHLTNADEVEAQNRLIVETFAQ